MNWLPFDVKNCPLNKKLLFLDDTGWWFGGMLVQDLDNTLMISITGTYLFPVGITHYMHISLPGARVEVNFEDNMK